MDTSEAKLTENIKKYDRVILVFIFSLIVYVIAGFYNDSFVEFMSIANYLTWHNLFEFASILVSFSVFTVSYFIYAESKNFKIIIFGCAFLFMGSLDAFHTLSYKGMPDFFIPNVTANRATTLWILARLIGSMGFLTAIIIPGKKTSNISKEVLAGTSALISIFLFLLVTYFPNFFPPMYIEGEGLTSIKIALEYLVIFILLLAFLIVSNRYKESFSNNDNLLMISLVLLIFSEFAFTSYGSIYDAFNYIGHLFKIIAFSVLYKAIYVENVSKPYREMKEAKDELRSYSDNLNIIVENRTKELEELNGILLNDIEYAREMQRCLLPSQMPYNMSVSFDVVYLAASNLSGDFYNVVKLDENNIALYIGDVSGHGISAAMLTVFAYQNIIQLKEREGSSEEILDPSYVLDTIYKSFNKTNIPDDKYIVMLYGVYNTREKTFKYSSAGINVSPYIVKNSGKLFEVNSKGFPICKLGSLVSPKYIDRVLYLEKGDKLFFYSDGLVEAKNTNGDLYGVEKLQKILKEKYHLNTTDINTLIKSDFYTHIGHGSDLMDDVTFLTMQVID